MKRNKAFSILVLVSMVVIPVIASAQTSEAPVAKDAAVAAPSAAAPAQPAKEIAIYGEVQNVNVSATTVSVQYYDYDSDAEKTTEIVAGGNVKLENVKTIADIKKGDWVDVTYTVVDGKNVASLISIEKEEPAEASPAPEAAPAAPAAQ
jgi:hypothetical protein